MARLVNENAPKKLETQNAEAQFDWSRVIGQREKVIWQDRPDLTRKISIKDPIKSFFRFFFGIWFSVGLFFLLLSLTAIIFEKKSANPNQENLIGSSASFLIGSILCVTAVIIYKLIMRARKRRLEQTFYAMSEKRILIKMGKDLASIRYHSELTLVGDYDPEGFGNIFLRNTNSPLENSNVTVNGVVQPSKIGFWNIYNCPHVYEMIENQIASHETKNQRSTGK